jgi:hypothetical protein
MEKHPKNSWKTRSEVVLIEKDILTVAIPEVMEKSEECPPCYLWTKTEEDFRKGSNSSKWLCLPHFTSAMRIICTSKLKNPIYVAQALLGSETKYFPLIENFFQNL